MKSNLSQRISLTLGSYWYWQCWFRKVREGGTPSSSRKSYNPYGSIPTGHRENNQGILDNFFFFFLIPYCFLLQWRSWIMWNSCNIFCSFTYLKGWSNWVIILRRTTRTSRAADREATETSPLPRASHTGIPALVIDLCERMNKKAYSVFLGQDLCKFQISSQSYEC